MKIGLLRSWFTRILLGSWALFLVGTLLLLLTALLPPGRLAGHLVTPLLILSVFVALGTFVYVAAYALSRMFYYLGGPWRRKEGTQAVVALRPVERILIAGWLLFTVAALGSLLFSHEKWVLAYGPEALFSLFCIVGLSSSAYASYLLLRQVMKRIRRG
jgi:hypothetical protein